MEETGGEIAELPPEYTVHIRNHFPKPLSDLRVGIDLPYGRLGGDGFERLCALLLIADGQTPRYFGKRGTSDYGVDVIVSDGASCVVYQCKNVASYNRGDLSRWLDTFAQAWLIEHPHLPKPQKYILLCPLEIRDKDDVETAQTNFSRRCNVLVEIWQKTTLDERLKRLPDTVSDLFSATAADFFCSLGHRWDDGFTAPLAPSGRGARAIDRFMKLQEEGRFAYGGGVLEERLDLIQDEDLVAFIGPSGAGKTMAALELASAMSEHGWRPWHIDMRNSDPARLYESIERRSVRPSVFVLDDCHLAPDQTHSLVTRLRTSGLSKRTRLILTVTTTAISDDVAVDDGIISQFIAEDIEPQQQINVRPKRELYRQIIETARPDLGEISIKTAEHLIATTAGNLFLLDEALRTKTNTETSDPAALNAITVNTLQKEVMRRYFGEQYPSSTTIRRIAAVAQFDVSVPKDTIEAPPLSLRDRMLVSTGPPPAWLFVHAGLAELIYSALSNVEAEANSNQFAVDAIVECGLCGMSAPHWQDKLEQLLRARLKLVADRPLKRGLLRDKRVVNALHDPDLSIPLSLVSLACFLANDDNGSSPYLELLFVRLQKILAATDGISARDGQAIGMSLRTLRLTDAERFHGAFRTSNPEFFARTLGAYVDLRGTMRILENATPGFAERLIEALDPDTLDAIVKKTTEEGRSIGTISFALRELGERDKDQRQLAAFETRLGTDRMISLIRGRADLAAMMRILENVTPGFAERLIEALDPDTLDTIVKKTTEEGRSIGTVGLALRELGDRDKDQRQLAAFEIRLGTDRMISLIRRRADLPSMMKILENATPGFAERLIEALDPDTLDTIVKKTTDEGRSIGTIGLALRELGDRDKDQRQLAAFEARLGTDRMISLIRRRADLPAMMKILGYVTTSFADRLIEALDSDTLDTIVKKTIDEGRSIGTIELALRDLRDRDEDQRQLAAFEARFGTDRMLRLIRERADLKATSGIIRRVTPDFADRLIEALDAAAFDAMVNNTIRSDAPNIRRLRWNRRFFKLLQEKLSAETWWRLILNCSDLRTLAEILVAFSPNPRGALLAALRDAEPAEWSIMLARTDAVGFCMFCSDVEPMLSSTARATFEHVAVIDVTSVVARSTWDELAIAHAVASNIQQASRATTAFLEQYRARIAAIDLALPSPFDDLSTAGSFIEVLWRERAQDRDKLANSVFDIIPNHDEWPLDYRRLLGTRKLLALAQSEDMPQQIADRLFNACALLPKEFKITSCNAKTLFLFLFNVWAVLTARAPNGVKTLVAIQDELLWTELLDHIDTLAKERDNEKKLDVLALVGLLQFTGAFSKERLDGRVRGVVMGFPFLLEAAEKRRAVTRFFTFRGLEMIGPRHIVNSRARADRLLSDLNAYEIQTPALSHLRDRLFLSL